MYLAIDAHDIHSIGLALVDSSKEIRVLKYECPPDGYLSALNQTFCDWKITFDDIEGLIVIDQDGSFTSTRVGVTIANSIAMARGIKIFQIKNSGQKSLFELLCHFDPSEHVAVEIVCPRYSKPPTITHKKTN